MPSQDLYRVETGRFSEHLEMLDELHRSGALKQGDWSLSFDDGDRSNIELAFPLLQRHELKAIFFVTAGWTENRSNVMSWAQLEQLVSAGHPVQSHGWSHAFLTGCSPAELEHELRKSRETLEDRLGVTVDSISAPGGRWNNAVIKACSHAGYQHLYTSDPLFEPVCEHGVWRHGRMMVRRNTQIAELRQFLTGDRRAWSKLSNRHRLKRALRRVLGEDTYHSLWRRLSAREKPLESDSISGSADGAHDSQHAHTTTD